MKKITTMAELMEILENGDRYYGLRAASEHDEEIMERGYLDRSVDMFGEGNWECWEYNEDCEHLTGTSALAVSENISEEEILERYNTLKNRYPGNTILLISDKYQEEGSDYNEVILGYNCGADVEAIVEF